MSRLESFPSRVSRQSRCLDQGRGIPSAGLGNRERPHRARSASYWLGLPMVSAVSIRDSGHQAIEATCLNALVPANNWTFALLACLVVAVAMGGLWWRSLRRQRELSEQLEQAAREQQQLELNLARHRRIDSLGLMAGSIAHDFNNLLQGVGGNVDILRMADDQGKFSRELVFDRLDAIANASERAQRLARQMLTYANKQFNARKTVDLNATVRQLESVVKSYSRNHQYAFEYWPGTLMSKVNQTQFEQAISNLVANAVDASPTNSLIKIRLRLESVPGNLPDNLERIGTRQTGGDFCVVEVQDQGCGISEQQRSRIFEPYYSNSEVGRGLGLAVVYGILESHDGLICLDSTPGKGTRFELWFPLADSDEDSIDEFLPQTEAPVALPAGATILVIDDDQAVRDSCEGLMQQLSVQVVLLEGGPAAIEWLSQPGRPNVDALLMDVMMPEMPAAELLKKLETLEVNIPVVLMTGYPVDRLEFLRKRSEVVTILAKPFSIADLKQALSQACQWFASD